MLEGQHDKTVTVTYASSRQLLGTLPQPGGQEFVQIQRRPAVAHTQIGAVGLLLPRQLVVAQGKGERFVDDTLLERLVINREGDLYPAEEIAVHPVGRRQVDLFLPIGIKVEHARVFEKAPHDGPRSEEHTSELQSRENLVCRLLLE